jgi:hypothetical protein
MKNLKFNFTAIIFLLTVCITLVANANKFNHSKISSSRFQDCYTTITYKDPNVGCSDFNLIINQALCPDVSIVGKPISLFINPVDPAVSCTSGNIFCCAKVRTITTPKCAQFNEITNIYCKPE